MQYYTVYRSDPVGLHEPWKGTDYIRHDFSNIPLGLRRCAENGSVEMALRRAGKEAGATVDRWMNTGSEIKHTELPDNVANGKDLTWGLKGGQSYGWEVKYRSCVHEQNHQGITAADYVCQKRKRCAVTGKGDSILENARKGFFVRYDKHVVYGGT